MSAQTIDQWLGGFGLDDWIRDHVAAVFENLPGDVRSDLMEDPAFLVCDYEPAAAGMLQVPVRFSAGGKPGRSVVLKRTMKRRPTPFVRWVIAHELAHAFLRHGGCWPE